MAPMGYVPYVTEQMKSVCSRHLDDVAGGEGCNGCLRQEFVGATAKRLGIRGIGSEISKEKGGYELREPTTPYSSDFDPKNATLSQENTYFWNESIKIST